MWLFDKFRDWYYGTGPGKLPPRCIFRIVNVLEQSYPAIYAALARYAKAWMGGTSGLFGRFLKEKELARVRVRVYIMHDIRAFNAFLDKKGVADMRITDTPAALEYIKQSYAKGRWNAQRN